MTNSDYLSQRTETIRGDIGLKSVSISASDDSKGENNERSTIEL